MPLMLNSTRRCINFDFGFDQLDDLVVVRQIQAIEGSLTIDKHGYGHYLCTGLATTDAPFQSQLVASTL
jgi:hypothetical protein